MDNVCWMCGGFGMLVINPETGYLDLAAACEECGEIGPDISGEEIPDCQECKDTENE